MASRADIDQAAQEAFKSLQNKARGEYGGDTHALLVVYAVESFLRRLSMSDHAKRMVLKGGMLMAANHLRRMTKDADLSTHGVAGDEKSVRELVAGICALEPEPHDRAHVLPVTASEAMDRSHRRSDRLRRSTAIRRWRASFPLGSRTTRMGPQ